MSFEHNVSIIALFITSTGYASRCYIGIYIYYEKLNPYVPTENIFMNYVLYERIIIY